MRYLCCLAEGVKAEGVSSSEVKQAEEKSQSPLGVASSFFLKLSTGSCLRHFSNARNGEREFPQCCGDSRE